MDPTVQVGRLERPPVAQRLFQDRELTEKKRGLNSALSLPSWDPGYTPKEWRGRLWWVLVYSYGDDTAKEGEQSTG